MMPAALSPNERLMSALPPLLYWYGASARTLPWRSDPTPYHVWISEIMLQQTRVEAVLPYYQRFLEACPDPTALSKLEDDKLMKLWEGLGYYSRARNLKKAATVIVSQHGGSLPCSYDALLSLPGIGTYTAGAIASIAFGLPTPAVDGNVLRVITRLLAIADDITKQKTRDDITALLASVYPKEDPAGASSLTQALMELGALVCIPNGAPHCTDCPWQAQCLAHAEDLCEKIPCKSPKKPRKIEQKTVLLLACGDRYALTKRPKTGLLAGMWEPVTLPGHLTPEALTAAFSPLTAPLSLPPARHIFTHIEWDMIGYRLSLPLPAEGYLFKTAEEIKRDFAIPSAYHAYLRLL